MAEIEQKDVIDERFERHGKLYIGFTTFAAYYELPLTHTELCTAIREARASGPRGRVHPRQPLHNLKDSLR